ncbi:glucosamine-6-phosphate deaminase [Candidatus Atribacteria bacterium HGW-Atribacteria-1]|nr:MAG: glucosamine-6-phosphate deaminase [Candidatus Atribacteria bacterium HGW-Atribacteria-1]
MKIVLVKDYKELSCGAAQLLASQIIEKKNLVLGLATGSTPIGMYKELIRRHREEGLDFSEVITFNLDEYYGLPPKHPQSYHFFMWSIFFKHINLKRENIHLLNGVTKNIEKECQQYEEAIQRAGGIDLQILGVGVNGHIGFNEPDMNLSARTHLVDLSPKTIQVNAHFFNDPKEVPKQAITMGIGTIIQAKRIVLLVSGREKASVINQAVNGPITTEVPVSVLRLHNDVTLMLDQVAASQLDRIPL